MATERRVREAKLLGPIAKVVLTCMWLALCAVPVAWFIELQRPGRVLHEFQVALLEPYAQRWAVVDMGLFMWLAVLVLSSGLYQRLIGYVVAGEVVADGPERGLEHLSAFARVLLRESRSIRSDIDATPLALERGWRLAQSLAAASPEQRAELEAYGARLDGIPGLVELSTRAGRRWRARRALRVRLEAELLAFESALVQPRRAGYR